MKKENIIFINRLGIEYEESDTEYSKRVWAQIRLNIFKK